MSLAAGVANRLYLAAAFPAHRRFQRALRDPAAAQRDVLLRILAENARSQLGLHHGFRDITSVAEFRRRVVPGDYGRIARQVEQVAHGTQGALTSHEVFCFEPTTGSSAASKLVPYTRALLREFSAATLPWIYDLLVHRPALRNGRAYWAVSPPVRANDRTSAGIPIGLQHDSDYFPAIARVLLDRVLGTPRALSRAASIDAARYLTLRALLALPDLAFVSVWNPSFLFLLAESLDEHWTRLLRDLESGQLTLALDERLRRELRRALPAYPLLAAKLRRRFGRRPPEDLSELWTRLTLISCWTEGHARRAQHAMMRRFAGVEVQGKGLLATEGVVSFPLLAAGGCVAAVTSHFLEFVPQSGSDALGVEELETGCTYEVLLTTSGGLYRYRLKDLVRVEGWYHRVPLLSFRGRVDRTSDLAGEKLTPAFADRVLHEATEATGVRAPFVMLAPVWSEPPRYYLFAECGAEAVECLARAVELRLAQSHHYDLCRRLGQLAAVHGVPVHNGERTYERVCLARGQRAGAIKPAALDERLGWEREFAPALHHVEAVAGATGEAGTT